jgi:hypothetical protein
MNDDSPRILLTGAGFTHDFGAPLAKEMWERLFNHPRVQGDATLRDLLLESFDFEDVYQEVMGWHDQPAKDAISEAVGHAYQALDDAIRECHLRSRQTLNGVCKLVSCFARPGGGDAFFTLNQDLLIERLYRCQDRHVVCPGIHPRPRLRDDYWHERLQPTDYIPLPTEDALKERTDHYLKSGLTFYVKLHGSQNWLDSSGRQKLVIGHPSSKRAEIEHEPLLSWYFELFQEALNRRSVRLLVIGYSFRDEHINSVLADAVTTRALSIHLLCPEQPNAFISCLREKRPRGQDITKGLKGYYQNSVAEVFPPDGGETPAKRDLWESFFGVR